MKLKLFARNVAYWTIPPAFQDLIRRGIHGNGHANSGQFYSESANKDLFERNRALRNKHSGERCFVLATGPSIKEQDLRPLRNEWCIACSEFFRHHQYGLIKPAYYAFAPNHPPFTDDDMLRELAEMKSHSEHETFFFPLRDKAVVERSGLVTDSERVHYLHFGRTSFRPPKIDLTGSLPGPCSAAVIATWIAIYMGFAEIYLIGCDHDLLWRWDGQSPFSVEKYYRHFYDGAPAIGYDTASVDALLKNAMDVRAIYRWSSEVASHQGTRIINANPRSFLDVVPRIALRELFEERSADR